MFAIFPNYCDPISHGLCWDIIANMTENSGYRVSWEILSPVGGIQSGTSETIRIAFLMNEIVLLTTFTV